VTSTSFAPSQISFVRTRDFRILSNGHTVFTRDSRVDVVHRAKTVDWILRIQRAQLADAGGYECQVRGKKKVFKALKGRDQRPLKGFKIRRLNFHFTPTQVSIKSGLYTLPFTLTVLRPRAAILHRGGGEANGELHLDAGSELALVCVVRRRVADGQEGEGEDVVVGSDHRQ